MNIGDIVTDYNGNKYKVITAGNKPNTPFIPNNIVNNDIVWGDIHLRKWGGADINYSEDEVCIGTWIDGKPLYQKTLTGIIPTGADSANSNILVDSIFGNIAVGFILEAYVYDSSTNQYFMLNEPGVGGANDSRIWVSLSSSAIRGRFDSAYISHPIVVTIQYTKTTD